MKPWVELERSLASAQTPHRWPRLHIGSQMSHFYSYTLHLHESIFSFSNFSLSQSSTLVGHKFHLTLDVVPLEFAFHNVMLDGD